MSNQQQSNQIPGVPDGWELVRIGTVSQGQFFVGYDGQPEQYRQDVESTGWVTIIRKIEKPAAYRHFANAEEYLPHWGKPIRLKGGAGFDSVVSTSRISVYVASESHIRRYAMDNAFGLFEFTDGTPFGVKIDE
jgi:hypothetical protein